MAAPTPRSLTLDLLSTLSGGSMPVAALVEAAGLFGIPDGSLRVALARLLADGRVERDGRGRYRLGSASAPLDDLVRSWRRLEERTCAWRGAWLGCWLPPRPVRGARKRSLRALRLLGFAELREGLYLRPANLRGGLEATRSTLLALLLEPESLTAELGSLDAASERRARALWDGSTLATRYDEVAGRLRASARGLCQRDEAGAMVESFLLGGEAIQCLVQDPLLPPEIQPAAARERLAAALLDYDQRGREAWASFLERYGVPHRSAPRDTRAVAQLERLRA